MSVSAEGTENDYRLVISSSTHAFVVHNVIFLLNGYKNPPEKQKGLCENLSAPFETANYLPSLSLWTTILPFLKNTASTSNSPVLSESYDRISEMN